LNTVALEIHGSGKAGAPAKSIRCFLATRGHVRRTEGDAITVVARRYKIADGRFCRDLKFVSLCGLVRDQGSGDNKSSARARLAGAGKRKSRGKPGKYRRYKENLEHDCLPPNHRTSSYRTGSQH
jgi:hypothetical protein